MWNPHNNTNNPTDDNSDTTRRDSDARVAAVSALAAFATGFPPPFGFAPPPPPERSFTAGSYAPQHPMFMTAAQNHAAFYAQPQSYGSTAPWGHAYAQAADPPATSSSPAPRGKPEAMAARLAALQVESTRQELMEEEEQQQVQQNGNDDDSDGYGQTQRDDDDSDDDDNEDEQDAVAEEYVIGDGGVLAHLDQVHVAPVATAATKTAPKKKAPAKPKSKPAPKGLSSGTNGGSPVSTRTERLLEEEAPLMTNDEYLSLQELLIQFCKVPLLNEFSRPVASLHPEVRIVIVSKRR